LEEPVKKILCATAVLLVAGPAFAQTILPNPTNDEARAPRPPRARGIPAALAVEAAMTANSICLTNGNKTTTVIIDSEGVPIALIAGDGAASITARIAMGKAMISLKTKGASADGAKADPAVMASLGAPRAGGFPILAGSDVVGAIAVSGSPSGTADEVCAKAAIAKIQDRVK
jgi:uncharacterized protein GlcG (DUF336 family)